MKPFFALLLALAPALAAAQFPPALMDYPPSVFVPAAFDAPYGKRLVAYGSKVVLANADPACLSQRGIDPASLEERVRAAYVKIGLRFFELAESFIDTRKFEEAFERIGGPGAAQDWLRLRSDPEVQALIRLNRRVAAVSVADRVVEGIDRHLLIKRILPAAGSRLSPIASGDTELLELGEKESDPEALHQFVQGHPSPAVTRWVALQMAFGQAAEAAGDRDGMLKYGPVQYTPDAAAEFAALCVGK